uniref:Small ribosomal subunit protein cS23 n=1 Tax=Cryptoglena skujai TaxID=161229 RepID=A0A0G3SFD7_9EUGL|nr:putative ribosomal protein 3 [Cryptoglena skujai]AKL38996.1 putative ribosomal protein 3 [Cryptoglena skujai]
MEKFLLKFLWLDKSIAVALDQRVEDKVTPLTEYYFWPQKDAWDLMKIYLEKTTWISQTESISLLNKITEVINFWQEKDLTNKKDIHKARIFFKDVQFIGYD